MCDSRAHGLRRRSHIARARAYARHLSQGYLGYEATADGTSGRTGSQAGCAESLLLAGRDVRALLYAVEHSALNGALYTGCGNDRGSPSLWCIHNTFTKNRAAHGRRNNTASCDRLASD